MTALPPVLARLGLSQYLDRFVAEGFDTWETLLDITESDLRELDVKLGHRRKLQREIAIARGRGTVEQLLETPKHFTDISSADAEKGEDNNRTDGARSGVLGTKRKYRRHPKPDESAPERAPSAYVIFSNKVREDLKPQNLSFTDIAKRVGEQWQLLPPAVKGQYESQASSAKEKFRAELEDYKKTDRYREYNEYLSEFRQKNACLDDKRPRLEKQPSETSSPSHSGPEQSDTVDPKPALALSRHRRTDSFGSMNTYSTTSEHPSPKDTIPPRGRPPVVAGALQLRSSSPTAGSPPGSWARRESSSFSSVFANVDKPPLSPLGPQDRIPLLDKIDPRTTSNHLAGLMQDAHMLRSRSTPLTMLTRERSQSSNSSPVSSALSTNASSLPASSLSHSSMTSNPGTTSAGDALSLRRLPPIQSVINSPSDLGVSSALQPTGYPDLRPDFNTATLPPPNITATIGGSGRVRNYQGPFGTDVSKPSFRGEYEARPWVGPESSFRGEYATESFSASFGADADPLSVLAYAGRIVDKEEGRSRRKIGEKPSSGSP